MNEVISKILDSLISKDSFLIILSSIAGAFSAFCFFIVGEMWRSKREGKKEWRKIYLEEHAYLVRYLQYLVFVIDRNINCQEVTVEQYNKKQMTLQNLQPLPIREDSSMKLDDMEFLNKIEQLMVDLKRINMEIETFNIVRNRMNDNRLVP